MVVGSGCRRVVVWGGGMLVGDVVVLFSEEWTELVLAAEGGAWPGFWAPSADNTPRLRGGAKPPALSEFAASLAAASTNSLS